jgi:hypothetical protein
MEMVGVNDLVEKMISYIFTGVQFVSYARSILNMCCVKTLSSKAEIDVKKRYISYEINNLFSLDFFQCFYFTVVILTM